MPIGVVHPWPSGHGGVTVHRESFERMIAEVAVYVDRFAAETWRHREGTAPARHLGTVTPSPASISNLRA
jgi:hypothetical protein